ncbi:MAG: Ig-like domain-containing protein, partial [Butyrivibrio sp.]|nr:Ig-like domain-containing protein [Butyrivibrio sp.]
MPATAYVDVTVHAYNYQKTLSYKVTVKEKNPLKGITLQKNLTVGVNNEVNLSALLNPVNPDNNPDLKWTISDKEIISISPYNECSVHIVGLKPGTATITVRTRDSFKTGKKEAPFTASCKVTVKPS